ncbi:hypothetical protein GCM10025865_23530 [Paraoerskovia sediminicola]|uniref:Probable membrane transporter protein n=1 Tax=Paraoerskovia sediminicola TaxID=1138587 RepID=A0ABN6XDY0_9CELL|nr:sulfite exporter TauE/SafE family protein [Paraoerskovia sediminicola]BDZ43054.1 hypothetical protein GCM10025865_23530 [Paraoerskovia sediminicola]
MTTALLLAVVVLGAALQRVSGMGFALVVGPLLVLLVGPVDGVLLVNLCGLLFSLLMLATTRGAVDWRRLALLAPSALVGIVPGALLLAAVSAPVLEIVVGVLVMAGMSAALLARHAPALDGRFAPVVAGAVSGAMSVTAGTSGPALAVYAVASRWDPRSFAATAQPYFVMVAAGSVTVKLLLTDARLPALGAWGYGGIAAGCVVGLFVGRALAGRLSPGRTRAVLVVVAFAGGLATAVRGVASL